MLPLSSFSDWKLEKNPVSGFITLIREDVKKNIYIYIARAGGGLFGEGF